MGDTENCKEWINGGDTGSGKESGVWQMVCTVWRRGACR